MGQNQTRNQSSLFLNERYPSKSQKKPNSGICYTGPLGSSCFGNKNSRNNNNSIQSWKEVLKEQLIPLRDAKKIPQDDWPQILLNFLETKDTEESDVHFQSDLFWADFNSAKKPIHYSLRKSMKMSKPRKSGSLQQPHLEDSGRWQEDNSSLDDSKVDMSESGQSDHKKDLGQDIKNMLEASAILDEKVYELAEKMNCVHQSFNMKRYEYVKSRSPSVDNVKLPGAFGDIRLVTKSLDYSKAPNNRLLNFSVQGSKTSNTMEERKKDYGSGVSKDFSWRPSPSLDPIGSFENNTFLVQKQAAKEEGKNLEEPRVDRESVNKELSSEKILYRAVQNYKTITGIMDKHMRQKENVLCILIELFEKYFEEKYAKVDIRLKMGNISLIEANDLLLQATRDLQQFLRILYEGTNKFYKLDKLKVARQTCEGSLFNRDNMLNFITSIVFSKKIYDVIFKLYQLRNSPAEKCFIRGLRKCRNFTPVDYGISEEYSLDDKTLKFLQEKSGDPQLVFDGNQLDNLLDSTVLEKEHGFPKVKSEAEISNGLKQDLGEESKRASLGPKTCEKSYEKPIQALRTLEYRRSPIHKLKTILKVAELVVSSIEDFYKESGSEYVQKLDGEQTMVIFMYILAKSGLNDVKVHCDIIQNFSTNSVLDSVSGYYATTLEACVNYICSISGEADEHDRTMSIDSLGQQGVTPVESEMKLEEKMEA